MKEHPNFGKWVRKLRERMGFGRREFAPALALKSEISVRNIEQHAKRSMLGKTTEALLGILGLDNEDELDALWRSGEMPDLQAVRLRVREAMANAQGETIGGQFEPGMFGDVLRWLIQQDPMMIRRAMAGVGDREARVVALLLVQSIQPVAIRTHSSQPTRAAASEAVASQSGEQG